MEFEHKVGAFDDEGLVVADKEKKDWKGIVISLLVIGSIMAAIIASIILCTPDGDVDLNKAKLELDLIVSDQYKIHSFNGSWLSDHEIVYVDQNGSIVIFDSHNNESTMLVKTYDKTLHTMDEFKLSPDRQSILFRSDMRYEFDVPVSGRYAIFNISSQSVEFLDDLIRYRTNPSKALHIQYACWGPRGNSILFIESNDIYYLNDYGQYRISNDASRYPNHSESSSDSSNAMKYLRLTQNDAKQNEHIRNGLPDSLYRNSIFKQEQATLWWSQEGRYLAYLSFDESRVEPNPVEYYDSYLSDGNYSPKIHYERLPLAGEINPQVSLHVIDLSNAAQGSPIESSLILAPSELLKQQQLDSRLGHYITHVEWLDSSHSLVARPNKLLVMWSNRAQTTSVLSLCENINESRSLFAFGSGKNQWKCEPVTTFSQRTPPNINSKDSILTATNQNGSWFIFFALPRPDSAIGDHYHVAMLREGERAPKYLTHGEFDVDRLVRYEPESDVLYFEAKVSERAERHLYQFGSVSRATGGPERQAKCLTCQLGEPCGYNYAHIAPKSRLMVHECLGPSIPATRLRELRVESGSQANAGETRLVQAAPLFKQQPSKGNATENGQARWEPLRSVAKLISNTNIESLVRNKQMPIEKFISIKSNGQNLKCDIFLKLYLPNEIEEEKDKRFPLLLEASELDQRNVWQTFDLDWGKYLASRKQIIYAKMDCIRPRQLVPIGNGGQLQQSQQQQQQASSSGRGASLDEDQLINSSPPLFNAKDQADAIKFLAENSELFPYIDRRRIAIYGPSSTSAYMALAATANDDSKLIQCTIAVSPITNWRYMNSYLAEHYLGLPWVEANSLRYERANLLKRSYEFALRKLLIIHGTADVQVHVQNSMQFLKSLTEHHITGGVLHQAQFYPDVGHSLSSVRRHFYLTLDGFVDRCFYQKPIAIKATEWKGKVKPRLY